MKGDRYSELYYLIKIIPKSFRHNIMTAHSSTLSMASKDSTVIAMKSPIKQKVKKDKHLVSNGDTPLYNKSQVENGHTKSLVHLFIWENIARFPLPVSVGLDTAD